MSPDQGGGGLEPERLWAVLRRKPWYMTREEFMDMDDWSMLNVYLRPNENEDRPEDGYWPVVRHDPSVGKPLVTSDFKSVVFHVWRLRGMTEEEMETMFAQEYGSYNG